MKLLKKNQVLIYVIALMLVTAGYLNYTANENTILTGSNIVENTSQLGDVGDATLVSSQDIVQENTVNESLALQNTVDIPKEQENIEKSNKESEPTSSNSEENADEYFVKSKLERDNMFSQTIETYQKILENPNVSEKQKSTASKEVKEINNTKNKIMICENLISTKGISNSVVFVNEDSINVILQKEKLEKEEVAQVQNIISREMNVELDQIHITNK